jgi:hypothetical protein
VEEIYGSRFEGSPICGRLLSVEGKDEWEEDMDGCGTY